MGILMSCRVDESSEVNKGLLTRRLSRQVIEIALESTGTLVMQPNHLRNSPGRLVTLFSFISESLQSARSASSPLSIRRFIFVARPRCDQRVVFFRIVQLAATLGNASFSVALHPWTRYLGTSARAVGV